MPGAVLALLADIEKGDLAPFAQPSPDGRDIDGYVIAGHQRRPPAVLSLRDRYFTTEARRSRRSRRKNL
jgi:hypothetical protein